MVFFLNVNNLFIWLTVTSIYVTSKTIRLNIPTIKWKLKIFLEPLVKWNKSKVLLPHSNQYYFSCINVISDLQFSVKEIFDHSELCCIKNYETKTHYKEQII